MKSLFLSAFCFLLSALSSVAQSKTPVMANTNGLILAPHHLAVTNWDGGDPWLWTFYGTSPNTVARLGDVVRKFNGPSDGQTATNLTLPTFLNFTSVGSDAMNDISAYQDTSLSALIFTNQDSGLLARLDGGGWYSSQFDASILYQINGNTVLSDNPAHQLNLGVGVYWTTTLLNPTGDGVTNNGRFEVQGPQTNYANFALRQATASKLASWNGNTPPSLTNSAFSDADISALQAAVGNTNLYVEKNAGRGTNNTFISATNTASASNQVASTFNGLAGQVTNVWEVRSNGVLIASISRDGSFTNLAAASFASGHFTIGTDGTVIDNNGNLNLSSPGAILAINSVGYTSPSTTEANIYGSGFTALATLYLGSRTSNTHAIVLANTPPGYIFRDGTKSSNCPVTVGTLTVSNNFLPGGLSAPLTIYYPSSSSVEFKVTTNGMVLGPSGGTITNILTASATLDFGSTTLGAVQDLPITVTGAADGDAVQVGAPQGSCTGIIGSYSGFASNGVVFVRFTSTGTAQDPASGTFRVIVTKF